MNKLFDLRFVIGSFFAIIGLILIVYSFTGNQWNLMRTIGLDEKYNQVISINRWCGGIFLVFGVVMVLLSLQKDAHDELLEEEHS